MQMYIQFMAIPQFLKSTFLADGHLVSNFSLSYPSATVNLVYVSLCICSISLEEKLLGQRVCIFIFSLASPVFSLFWIKQSSTVTGEKTRVYGHRCRYVGRYSGNLSKFSSDSFYFISETERKVIS